MTYVGKISKGAIVLPPDVHLPEGMVVEVKPLRSDADEFTDALEQIAARVKGLPSDLAKNHDHYLYGLPKK